MFIAQIGQYQLNITNKQTETQQSYLCELQRENCVLQKKLKPISASNEKAAYIFVSVHSGTSPDVLIEGNYSPFGSGFEPGVLIVPEHHILFFGAGTQILTYSLSPEVALITEYSVEIGFWGWVQHKNFVILLAELEFSVWNLDGKKIWSQFVEPPWDYDLNDNIVSLDIMGCINRYDLYTGAHLKS